METREPDLRLTSREREERESRGTEELSEIKIWRYQRPTSSRKTRLKAQQTNLLISLSSSLYDSMIRDWKSKL
jgi:hypothetical protein